MTNADILCQSYLDQIVVHLSRILEEENGSTTEAAQKIADQIAADGLVHAYGPGGHSNLAAQEIFFRAGGLMHIAAILDEGTLVSNGALRSMAIERVPGYGKVVIENADLKEGNLLILVNAYGVNCALIDAALEARRRGVFLIGVSSHGHALACPKDHPSRHPTAQNLQDLVDIAIDSKVPMGDAILEPEGMSEKIASVSTFANAFTLNTLVIRVVSELLDRGIEPPVWRSGYAPGGDAANARFIERFRARIPSL